VTKVSSVPSPLTTLATCRLYLLALPLLAATIKDPPVTTTLPPLAPTSHCVPLLLEELLKVNQSKQY